MPVCAVEVFPALLFALRFFRGHGVASDEFDEALAVLFRWNGGDLRLVV